MISGLLTDGQGSQLPLKGYVFTGRVHPERHAWGMGGLPEALLKHADGSQTILKFDLSYSQLTVLALTNKVYSSIYDLKNRVNRSARIALDAMGHVLATALDLEIVSCVDPDGQVYVFNTGFDGLRDKQSADRDRHEREMLNLLIERARVSPNISAALEDLRKAIREPGDTCVNCYRAVESIRQEYLGEGPESSSARQRSWARLREVTGVEESELRWLEKLATPRRHGRPVDLSHADREHALRLARRVVEQYCLSGQADRLGAGSPNS
jgi:hypothetical protein